MSNIQYEYEYDPYGDNPLNLIEGEAHTITAANGTDFNLLIPRKGPFHRRSFRMYDASTGQDLTPTIDYFFAYRFDQILKSGSMQPVYAGIVMLDNTRSANVKMDYQTLGGSYTLSEQQIVELLANKQRDPRTVLFENVIDVPDELPATPHRQNVNDFVGYNAVVDALYNIADAIEVGNVKSMQALMEHVADHHNPHRITLEDLGIDELGNLVPATKDEAEQGTDTAHYMSALRVRQAMDFYVVPLLNAHINDKANPHGTTAAQVGLGNVQNYSMASAVEAAAGVATNRYMSPSLTRTLLMALAPEAIAFHTGNTNNPHGTTKAQVGLGNVLDYRVATEEEALAGTSNTLYVTPYLVNAMIANQSGQGIAAHVANKNNPHEVTKTQVGLGNVMDYPIATVQQAIQGTSNETYMTPYLVAKMLADMGNYTIADDDAIIAGTSNDTIVTPHGLNVWLTNVLDGRFGTPTKESIGLGNVENYPPATDEDLDQLTNDQAYVTPADLAYFRDNTINQMITLALNGMTPLQLATDDEAIAGVDDKYWTPAQGMLQQQYTISSSPLFTFLDDTAGITATAPYDEWNWTDNAGRVVIDGHGIRLAMKKDEDGSGYAASEVTLDTGSADYTVDLVLGTVGNFAGVITHEYTGARSDLGFFGVGVQGNKVYLGKATADVFAPVTAAGTVDLTGTPVAGDKLTFHIRVNYATMEVFVDVKLNGGTASAAFPLTEAVMKTYLDEPDTTVITNAYGMFTTAAPGKTDKFFTMYLPETTAVAVDATGAKWAYTAATGWAQNAAAEIEFVRGYTYYNPNTSEIAVCPSNGKLIPFGPQMVITV